MSFWQRTICLAPFGPTGVGRLRGWLIGVHAPKIRGVRIMCFVLPLPIASQAIANPGGFRFNFRTSEGSKPSQNPPVHTYICAGWSMKIETHFCRRWAKEFFGFSMKCTAKPFIIHYFCSKPNAIRMVQEKKFFQFSVLSDSVATLHKCVDCVARAHAPAPDELASRKLHLIGSSPRRRIIVMVIVRDHCAINYFTICVRTCIALWIWSRDDFQFSWRSKSTFAACRVSVYCLPIALLTDLFFWFSLFISDCSSFLAAHTHTLNWGVRCFGYSLFDAYTCNDSCFIQCKCHHNEHCLGSAHHKGEYTQRKCQYSEHT